MIWPAIDGGLGVIALDVAILGLHDAALRIGEVALGLAVGLGFRRCRRSAVLFAAFGVALLFRLGPRRISSSAAALASASSSALACADLLEPLLFVGHPIRHLVAALAAVELVLLRIGGFGRFQPAVDLRLKLGFPLPHVRIAHGLMLGGVRLDLGAVERDMPELHQAGLLGKLQHLHEQTGQRLQMPLAEIRDRAEVRRITRHDHHEVRTLHRRFGDPPRRIEPARIAMQKQRRHHPRIKRRLPRSARVAARYRRKIKLFPDQRNDQPRQVILRHIVLHARRQKLSLVNLPGAKMFAHTRAEIQFVTKAPAKAASFSGRQALSLGDLAVAPSLALG